LGGGSNLKDLTKTLSESLHIPVKLGDNLERFPSVESLLLNDKPETINRFTSAIGAALASPRSINLLPIEIKQQTKLLIKRSTIEALVTAAFVILILVYTGMRIKLGNYQKRLAAAETELTALSTQSKEMPTRIFLQSILTQRPYWSDVLKEISNIIPEQIRLTEMNAQDNTLTLRGQIKSQGPTKENFLTGFIRTLEKGIFKEVNLISQKNSIEDKLSHFELKLELE